MSRFDRQVRDAHAAFDAIWLGYPKHGRRAFRNLCYAWLAEQLGRPGRQAHFRFMDAATIERVLVVCAGTTWRDVLAWDRGDRSQVNRRRLALDGREAAREMLEA